MIHTKATDKHPAIQWELSPEIIEKDSEERMVVKRAIGTDADSELYVGSAEYSCGELVGIRDVELL